MYTVLNEALGWSESTLPSEKLVLISDSLSADGSFLLPHFINFYVKSKQRVVLVGLEQGFGHYMAISKKLVRNGINLQQAAVAGEFAFINGMAAPYDWTDAVTTDTNNPAAAAIQSIANALPFSLQTKKTGQTGDHGKDPLESLYRLIERCIPANETRSVAIVIDNLSAITHVVGEEEAIQFVQYCRSLAEEHSKKHNNSSCVVLLAHADVDQVLVAALSHTADLVMKVEGFKTGYSNEEDGQLSFYSANPPEKGSHKLPVLIYKLSETNVNFRIVRKFSSRWIIQYYKEIVTPLGMIHWSLSGIGWYMIFRALSGIMASIGTINGTIH